MKGNTIIKVQDHPDKKWMDCFEGMAISYEGDTTTISGNIKDEAHMHGILNQIRELNLKLISVNPAEKQNDKNVIMNNKIQKNGHSV